MNNILTFAYLGDSVFELYVREMLIKRGIVKINLLQKEAVKYVSAVGQVVFLEYLINHNVLTELELDIVKRGRNAKVYSHPKNTDIVTYKWATAFECLFGYLYLKEDKTTINDISLYKR